MLERTGRPDDILLHVVDDYEEAPWLVMSDPQGWSVNHFASTLDAYAARQQPAPYVAMLLPVYYWSTRAEVRRVVSPDTVLVRVPRRHRDSYDVELEGVPPAFVLEVVSPESVHRDLVEKLAIYQEMGVQEYVVFGPPTSDETAEWPAEVGEVGVPRRTRRRRRRWPIEPALRGWRRDEDRGVFVEIGVDASARWWSAELGLWLAVREDELGLQLPNGEWLLTHAEEIEARRQAEARAEREAETRARETEARSREAEARRLAEAEVERLRQEIERLHRRASDQDH